MEKLFNNLLVPVIESEDVTLIAKEAIRMADQLQCQMHLLYFVSSAEQKRQSLQEGVKTFIQERNLARKGLPPVILITRQSGSPMKSIISYYKRHSIDLILLGRKRLSWRSLVNAPLDWWRNRFRINANLLLKKVNCPVLMINGRKLSFGLKNIVLPVGDFLPMRKLLFATYLAKLTHSTIHLIAASGSAGDPSGILEGEPDEALKESLFRSYRLLKENTDLSVRCMTIPGENLGDIAWNYAKRIKADLILIGPGKESLLSGFLSGLQYLDGGFSRSIFNISRIPVMSVR